MKPSEKLLGKNGRAAPESNGLPIELIGNRFFYLWKDAVFSEGSSLFVPMGYGVAFIREGRFLKQAGAGTLRPFHYLKNLLNLSGSDAVYVDVAVARTVEYHDNWVNGNRVRYRDPITGIAYHLGMSGDYSLRVEYLKFFFEYCLGKNWSFTDMKMILGDQSNDFLETIRTAAQEHIIRRNYGKDDIDSSLGEIGSEVKRRLNIAVFNRIGIEVVRFSINKHVHAIAD